LANQNAVFRFDLGADLEAPPATPGLWAVRSSPIREVPVAVAIKEILELTRGFLFRDPVPLLDSAGALIAPTGGLTLWIIGEPAPLFFHFPAELPPVAFETILIHLNLLLLSMRHVKEGGLPCAPVQYPAPPETFEQGRPSIWHDIPRPMCGLCANTHTAPNFKD
jgi:hypothetical protein